jgi:hypothetical protein
MVSHYNSTFRTAKFTGPWTNGVSGKGFKAHYLGLKLLINGKFHYGWARVDSTDSVLTGYAYETVHDRPIVAGQEKRDICRVGRRRFWPRMLP